MFKTFSAYFGHLSEVEQTSIINRILSIKPAINNYSQIIGKLKQSENFNKLELIRQNDQKNRKQILSGIDQYLTVQSGLPKKLREHQFYAVMKIAEFIRNNKFRGYIEHPTGLGKTILFCSLIKMTHAKTLIIVPKRVLLQQVINEVSEYLPTEKISFIGSVPENSVVATKGYHGQVVIVVDKSFKDPVHLNRLIEADFRLLLWDEVHHSYDAKSQQCLAEFGSTIMIGFTATPDHYYLEKKRGCREVIIDNLKLFVNPRKTAAYFYPNLIDKIGLREAIMDRMLAPLAAAMVDIDLDMDDLGSSVTLLGEDFNESNLVKYWPVFSQAAIHAYQHGIGEGINIRDRKIFCVCPRIQQAENLAEDFSRIGLKAVSVTSQTTPVEREEIFRRYSLDIDHPDQIQLITSVSVLAEGWDAPEAEVFFMLRPTKSRLFYQQVLGRVLRLNPQKTDKVALAVDFLGRYRKCLPMSAPLLFGITNFKDGEIIIPPKGSYAPGNGGEDEIINPFQVSLKSREIFLTGDVEIEELIEEKEKGVITVNGILFVTKDKLRTLTHIKSRKITEIISKLILKPFSYGAEEYFNPQLIIYYYFQIELTSALRAHREKNKTTVEKLSTIFSMEKDGLESIIRHSPVWIETKNRLARIDNTDDSQLLRKEEYLVTDVLQVLSRYSKIMISLLGSWEYYKEFMSFIRHEFTCCPVCRKELDRGVCINRSGHLQRHYSLDRVDVREVFDDNGYKVLNYIMLRRVGYLNLYGADLGWDGEYFGLSNHFQTGFGARMIVNKMLSQCAICQKDLRLCYQTEHKIDNLPESLSSSPLPVYLRQLKNRHTVAGYQILYRNKVFIVYMQVDGWVDDNWEIQDFKFALSPKQIQVRDISLKNLQQRVEGILKTRKNLSTANYDKVKFLAESRLKSGEWLRGFFQKDGNGHWYCELKSADSDTGKIRFTVDSRGRQPETTHLPYYFSYGQRLSFWDNRAYCLIEDPQPFDGESRSLLLRFFRKDGLWRFENQKMTFVVHDPPPDLREGIDFWVEPFGAVEIKDKKFTQKVVIKK